MKTKNCLLLGSFILLVGCISTPASDNPAQAAARSALMQKLAEMDKPQIQPVPALISRPETTEPLKSVEKPKAPVASTVMAPPSAAASVKTVRPVAAPASTHQEQAVTKAKAVPSHTPIKTQNPPVAVKTGEDIATVNGEIYKDAHVEKIEPDGIIISYSIADGGLAITHVNFSDLPASLRARYQK